MAVRGVMTMARMAVMSINSVVNWSVVCACGMANGMTVGCSYVVAWICVTAVMTVSIPSVEGSKNCHDDESQQTNKKESFEHHFSATYDHLSAKKLVATIVRMAY